jgi:hypothetical protein
MYADDIMKLSAIFASLAESMDKKASTVSALKRARKNAVMFDNQSASVFAVLGLNKPEQYHSRLRDEQWDAITKHCQWDEDWCVWTVKLNERLNDEIKDSVLRNKFARHE